MTVPPFWGCLIAATHSLNQAVAFAASDKLAYAAPVDDNVTAAYFLLPHETGTFPGVVTKPDAPSAIGLFAPVGEDVFHFLASPSRPKGRTPVCPDFLRRGPAGRLAITSTCIPAFERASSSFIPWLTL
jgi:hypothetical protein